jgi:hypothetical protein
LITVSVVNIGVLLVIVALPVYVVMRLAQAKKFYPVWPWVVAAVFLSWIVLLVTLFVPRREESQ